MSLKFRKELPELGAEEQALLERLLQLAEELHDTIDMAPPSRARDNAFDRLQECVNWSLKAIADHR